MSPEEKQAQLLSEWLDGPPGTEPPAELDQDVVESMAALRPALLPMPNLDLDSIWDDVHGAQDAPAAIPEPANERRTDVEPVPHTRPWWLGASGGLVIAFAAVVALGIGLSNFQMFAGGGQDNVSAPASGDFDRRDVAAPEVADGRPDAEPELDAAPPTDGKLAQPPAKTTARPARKVAAAEAESKPDAPLEAPAAVADVTAGVDAGPAVNLPALASTDGDGAGPRAPTPVVTSALQAARTPIAACYADATGRDRELGGAVYVEWGVSGGKTRFATVDRDSTGDPVLGQCILTAIRAITWPAGADGEWRERWAFTPIDEPIMRDAMMEDASEAAE